jgi:tetratricopeptide (TPR) repeat protein
MKKISFIWILSCLTISHGMTQSVDSLLSILKKNKSDTTAVNILNELFFAYEFTDTVKARQSLERAFILARKNRFDIGLSKVYLYTGYLNEDCGNYTAAIKNYNFSLKIKQRIHDNRGAAEVYNNIGAVYNRQGDYIASLENYAKALAIRKKIGEKRAIAATYNGIGNVYTSLGNYAKSLKNHYAALKFREEIGEPNDIATSFINIGVVLYKMEKLDAALKNYSSALKIFKSAKNKKGEAYAYHNIGSVYYDLGILEKNALKRNMLFNTAIKDHNASLRIKETLGDKLGIAQSYNNLGNVYTKLADSSANVQERKNYYESALKNFHASLELKKMIGDKAGMASSCDNIGDILRKQKKYSDAFTYFTKAKELGLITGTKEVLRNTYANLALLDSVRNDFKSALTNYDNYLAYKDSLDNEETSKKTLQSQLSYEFDKKAAVEKAEHKRELANQKKLAMQEQRQRNIILSFIMAGLAITILFAVFILRSLRVTVKQKKTIGQQKQLVEHQKEIIDEKQKELMDSIHYAKRIQVALLPGTKYIERYLKK